MKLLGGNFYFKQNPQGQLFLVFASCIKTDKVSQCLNGHREVEFGLMAYQSQPSNVQLAPKLQ